MGGKLEDGNGPIPAISLPYQMMEALNREEKEQEEQSRSP